MAYVVLLSAGIGACAIVAELLLRSKVSATRWVWISTLSAIMVVVGVATFAPLPAVRESPITTTPSLNTNWFSLPVPVPAAAFPGAESVVRYADAVLPTGWIAASLFLLMAIIDGQRRLHRERRDSKSTIVNGREILLTDNSGPAVAGIGRPVVLLPRWVLALDARSQELLLAHEFEHIKRGDTRVLLAGAVATALMPWNPVVWWGTRRLRLAVEQDCDARVLRSHPDVRRYADLLLVAASRPRMTARLLAAHFGEHRSDLDRRIQAMTDRRLQWRRALVAAAAAVALVGVSCEAPRPEPLAPGASVKTPASPQVVSANDVLYEFQVEKPVMLVKGSATPKYPEILRQAGVEGEVLVSFVVNEQGEADVETFKVIRRTHDLFAVAVKQALSSMRFTAAEVGGKKVRQLVQQPFSFALPGLEINREKRRAEIIEERVTGKRLAYSVNRNDVSVYERKAGPRIVFRRETGAADAVNFELLSSQGEVVSRYPATNIPREVKVDDISGIEVFKPKACPAASAGQCPLIRITLKAGRDAEYRKQ